MGIIAVLIGLPVTASLLAIGFLIILGGQFFFKKIKNKGLKLVVLFISHIPMAVVCALYLAGIYTAMKHYLTVEGVNNVRDILFMLIASMMVGTFNVIEPGSVLMGDNGPIIDTTLIISWTLLVTLIISMFLVKNITINTNKKAPNMRFT